MGSPIIMLRDGASHEHHCHPTDGMSKRDMCWSPVCGATLLWVTTWLRHLGLRWWCAVYVSVRRISCLKAEPTAVADFCWEHGHFRSNATTSSPHPLHLDWLSAVINPHWVLQAYVYFLIRIFLLAMPHVSWNLFFKTPLASIIKSSADMVRELETHWLRYGERATHCNAPYAEAIHSASPQEEPHPESAHPDSPHEVPHHRRVSHHNSQVVHLEAIQRMTRDIIQITHHQIPTYSSMLTFVQLRLIVDVVLMSLFVLLDFLLFKICAHHRSTDWHCELPNGDSVQCTIPLVHLLQQAAILSLFASCFTLLMLTTGSICLICHICSPKTNECFLELLPRASQSEDLKFKSVQYRKTYKLISKHLLQNYCIIQPVNFLRSFVKHLEDNNCIESSSTSNQADRQYRNKQRLKNEDGKDNKEVWEQLVTSNLWTAHGVWINAIYKPKEHIIQRIPAIPMMQLSRGYGEQKTQTAILYPNINMWTADTTGCL